MKNSEDEWFNMESHTFFLNINNTDIRFCHVYDGWNKEKWMWLQEISKYWLLLFLFVKLIDTAIMIQTNKL